MADLATILGGVAAELSRHDFADCDDVTAESRASASSLYPLRLFVAWLDRCPEARQSLLAHGLSWADAPVESTPEAVRAGRRAEPETPNGPGVFRMDPDGKGWRPCRVLDVKGHLAQVKVVGKPGEATPIRWVSSRAVHPADQPAFMDLMCRHPGSNDRLQWDDGTPAVPG